MSSEYAYMSLTEMSEAVAVKVLALDGKAHPFADNLVIQKVILEALKEAEQYGKRNCAHSHVSKTKV